MILRMADQTDAHPLNAPGPFFNDLSCIDCGLCPDRAPTIFRRDHEEGYSYVFKQPQSKEEETIAQEALEECPTESIGKREI